MKIKEEFEHTMLGVPGRMFTTHRWDDRPTFSTQTWKSETRNISPKQFMQVQVRFDDTCRNGHNTFAITGTTWEHRRFASTGCETHDEIAEYFPKLTPLIKWHLCSTDGPMYYVADTIYHVGDLDCWGKRKGKARDFAVARTTAIWPEATDEQLSLPKDLLTILLNARLPALVADFRKDIEAAGFQYA